MSLRVLITGGLGYVGGRVAQALVAAGYELTLATRRENAPAPNWLPGATVCAVDWSSRDQLIVLCSGQDVVVHLAAMNEIESARDPVGALLSNGVATLNLLEAAIASRVKRFVYMSTAHVYGSPLQGRIDERTLPRAQHPYAITHKVAEDFVLAAHDQGKIEGLVLRLSNGFGAPSHAGIDRWSLVVNDLCRQAVVSGALRLKSAGLQSRDFITLQDVGRAVVHCLSLGKEGLNDGLFNLGGDCVMRIVDMAELIRARWQSMTGICLPFERPEATASEVLNEARSRSLIYSSAKLQTTGFSLLSLREAEIDATLALCRHSFGAADLV
jgi:UDP-glucose 4-epimerase